MPDAPGGETVSDETRAPEDEEAIGKILADVRAQTGRMSGATVSVFTSDFGGGFKQIQLQLRGQDVNALAQAADMVKAEVQRVPGAVDIGLSTKGQKPELTIELNRGVAVPQSDVEQNLRC